MQLGTENRKKTIWAVVLGAIAIVLVAYEFMPSGSTSASAPAIAPTAATTSGRPGARPGLRSAKKITAGDNLDPMLRLDELAATERIQYEGSGRNIFVSLAADIPKPAASGVTGGAQEQARIIYTPPPVPPAQPIPLKFFGFASKPGEPKKVFLVQGEDVFVAGEGEIVDRRYKVIRISPNSVEMQDVVGSGQSQTINLTQG